ncbi:MAG: ribosomal-protein-alanine N-acetyltransferase [Leptolyngbya sp. DLM2.Bin27]|nr:MAG: ribosomal-protein-alanine N-acetyltransferase [Leptolyngbya sp. DLM2.Bin27]
MGYLSCQTPGHNDIAALVALDQRALGGLWSAEGYAREIDSPNSCLLVLVQGFPGREGHPDGQSLQHSQGAAADPSKRSMVDPDQTIGLGCYWAILDEAHITVLAVDPRYQRRGLGKWLLVNLLIDAGERALTRATLEVRPSNSRALALYESFGFETLGRRRRYYTDGEDALILWQNSLKTPEFRDRLGQQRRAAIRRLGRQGWQISD